MITELVAIGYGCLKDVRAALTPLHAFIGPNDSGKSTILRALRTVTQLAGGQLRLAGGKWHPFDPWLPITLDSPKRAVVKDFTLACSVHGGWYRVTSVDNQLEEQISNSGDPWSNEGLSRVKFWQSTTSRSSGDEHFFRTSFQEPEHLPVLAQLRPARLVQFDGDSLRRPSGLIPHGHEVGFLDERGSGLPGVYQTILGRGDDAFAAIRQAVQGHFPTIKRIGVVPVTTNELELEAELHDGTIVRAARMSEGLLYYLAYAALPYLAQTSAILVEEPENGLHPARIADIVSMMRRVVKDTGTQIIMATHSPLVINELEPEEVTVVTRSSLEEGCKLTPIAQTPSFRRRASVYALGELWLSYADGIDEGPLFRAQGS